MNTLIRIILTISLLTSYMPVKALADPEYQLPTFIGADSTAQKALMSDLAKQQEPSDSQQRQYLLVQLAVLANDKDTRLEQLVALEKSLQAYLKQHKQDAEIMAASGSVISLQSLHYQDNLGKMNFLSRKGMRLMDRAVKQYPNNLGARLLRGLSYANMPAFLNRAGFAKTDLELVKAHLPTEQDHSFVAFVDQYLAMAVAKLKGETP